MTRNVAGMSLFVSLFDNVIRRLRTGGVWPGQARQAGHPAHRQPAAREATKCAD